MCDECSSRDPAKEKLARAISTSEPRNRRLTFQPRVCSRYGSLPARRGAAQPGRGRGARGDQTAGPRVQVPGAREPPGQQRGHAAVLAAALPRDQEPAEPHHDVPGRHQLLRLDQGDHRSLEQVRPERVPDMLARQAG